MKKISGAKIRRGAIKIIIGLLALTGVGYISSVATQRQCENAAALSLVNGQMQSKPFFVILGDDISHTIFSRVGARFTSYTVIRNPHLQPGKGRISRFTWPAGQPMPHVDKGGRTASVSNAHIFLPFLASVEHTAVYGSLGADGSTSFYLCLFGFPIKVKEETSWVS